MDIYRRGKTKDFPEHVAKESLTTKRLGYRRSIELDITVDPSSSRRSMAELVFSDADVLALVEASLERHRRADDRLKVITEGFRQLAALVGARHQAPSEEAFDDTFNDLMAHYSPGDWHWQLTETTPSSFEMPKWATSARLRLVPDPGQ